MLPHSFAHDGTGYEVSFRRMDGQWFAVLCRNSDRLTWPLPPFTDDAIDGLSEPAIRAGYIGLSQWLVAQGRWPEAAEIPALQPQDGGVSVRIERKSEPSLDPAARDLIGRELRAMYAEIVEQPLPDDLVALLNTQETGAKSGKLLNRAARPPSADRKLFAKRAS